MSDTITLSIDDRQVSVPPGTLVVEAARQAGIDIPVFCHHPKLSPAGACGMCLVEVGVPAMEGNHVRRDENSRSAIRWLPDLQTACTTPASEGMVVRTQTEQVARARQDVLASLLAHHPLDCPTCDKGGECLLQDYVMAHGEGISRMEHEQGTSAACRTHLGDLIILHLGRCIQCGRCVRFQAEIADDPLPGCDESKTGDAHPPSGSYWSGNTTDLCPVGALITTDFYLGARPWELSQHASLCNHCPAGCNITLHTRVENHPGGRTIKRVTPRQNEQVNETWICDKGRYGHHHTRAADRLTVPLVRNHNKLVEASWDEALDLIARRIPIVSPHQVAGVVGDRLSNEDLFLFQALMRDVIGTPHVDAYPSAPGADLVARYGLGADSDWRHLDQNSAILVVAGDVEEQVPLWFLGLKAAAQRGAKLIIVNGRATKLDRYASHRLRIRYGSAPHLLLGLTGLLLESARAQATTKELKKLQADLSGLGPASIQRLTGIAADDLQAAAETLGQAEDAIVVFGREGLNDYSALALAQAAANLLVATGHVGRANSGLLPLWPHNNTQGAADMGVRPNAGPGYQEIIEYGWNFDSMLSAASNRGIRLMWMAGADPVGDDPTTTQALEGLDFLVVQELFLTDTARLADVVLPALSFAERDGTYTSGDRRVQRFERALPPLGQGRADWAILADVAGRLGADWEFRSSASVLAAINKAVPPYARMTLEALRLGDGGQGLRWSTEAEGKGTRGNFEWVELPTLQDAELIAVPVRWLYRQGTLINRSALLSAHLHGAVVELNPHDAAGLDLPPGTLVSASLGRRAVELIVRLNQRVPEGTALVPGDLPTGPLAVETRLAPRQRET